MKKSIQALATLMLLNISPFASADTNSYIINLSNDSMTVHYKACGTSDPVCNTKSVTAVVNPKAALNIVIPSSTSLTVTSIEAFGSSTALNNCYVNPFAPEGNNAIEFDSFNDLVVCTKTAVAKK